MSVAYNIYCISGLAANEEIFRNLRINAPLHHLKWLDPLLDEPFEDYILRLKAQITATENLILIGVSFGGMVAVSLNRYLPVKKTIIISSIRNHEEKPELLKNKWVKLIYPLFVPYMIKAFPGLCFWAFGAKTAEEKALLRALIKRADNYYLSWSVRQILEWDNKDTLRDCYQLNGTADRLFKIENIRNPIKIEGGTHLMLYNKAGEISNIINGILEN